MDNPQAKFELTAEDRTGSAFASATSNLESFSGKMLAFAKANPFIAGAASVAAVYQFSKAVFEAADAVGDLAARIGVSASELSRLKYIANQNDVEFQSLAIGVKQFQKSLSEGKPVLDQLGVSATELKGVGLTEQFETIAEAFQKVENPADRTRIAMELFGKSGTDLIPILLQGKEGIKQLGLESDRIGATMSDEVAAKVGQADEALKRMKASAMGLATTAIGDLSPALTKIADLMTSMGAAINKLNSSDGKSLPELQAKMEWFKAAQQWKADHPILDKLGLSQTYVADVNKSLTETQQLIDKISTTRALAFTHSPGHESPNALQKKEDAFLEPFSATAKRVEPTGAQKAAELDAQLQQFIQSIQIGGAIDQGMQNLSGQFVQLESNAQLEMKSLWDQSLNDYSTAEILKTEIAQQEAERRAQIEQASQLAIASYRQQTLGLGIQGLSMLGRHSKAAAIAAIALNRGQAIAHIGMSIAEANAKAISLGPWGWALIAANVALGAAEIANVNKAASGASTIGGTNASLPGLGGAVNPVFNQGATQDSQTQGASQQKVVTVNIMGHILGPSAATQQWLADTLKEAVEDRDVVFMSSTSRQAQELIPA